MKLTDKIAIVTGASSGLGYEFSKALINKDAKVYGLARSEKKLESIADEFGSNFSAVKMDIIDFNSLKSWVDSTFSENYLPDILINNAGVGLFGGIDELSPDQWNTMLQTNLTGVYNLTHLIVPFLKKNRTIAHIINIASVAGLVGNPSISGYNATKFGLRGFSEALFKELRYDGIKVSCLFPGSIATNFFDNVDGIDVHDKMMRPEDVAETVIYLLETADNYLINEITMRPLMPK